MLEKLTDAIEKIPHIYYYVDPCPKCGSRKTGRYVRRAATQDDARYIMEESLRNGELIRFAGWLVPKNNAYCEDCGHEWPCRIQGKPMTEKEVMEEKAARGTNAKYAEYTAANPRKKKSFFGKIFGFLP